MNDVKLSGRPTTDIELKHTPQGTAVCTFALAVDRRTKEDAADFPTIVAWKHNAEFASKYIKKGRKIIVEGEIRTRLYEDRDGKKRKETEVHATHFEFADSKPADNANTGVPAAPAYAPASMQSEFEELSDNEELPF